MPTAKAKAKDKAADEPTSWTLVAPVTGNEYIVTSPVDRFNLMAQGYTDKDPAAAEAASAAAEQAATEQGIGGADGAHAVDPATAPTAGSGSSGASSTSAGR